MNKPTVKKQNNTAKELTQEFTDRLVKMRIYCWGCSPFIKGNIWRNRKKQNTRSKNLDQFAA